MGSVAKGFVWVILMMALALTHCGGNGYIEPLNCRHLECSPYQVIHSQEDFEIRSYTNAMWMTTSPINSSSYRDAASRGFKLLFAYIQGKNHEAAKINMTAPVMVDIYPSTQPIYNSSFVVHFYVPQKYQNSPPISDEATPLRLPFHKFAAIRRFGGFLNDTTIATQALALKKSLNGTPWDSPIGHTAPKFFSVAGYNSPRQYDNRVNEVILWFDKF